MRITDRISIIIFAIIVLLDGFLWREVLRPNPKPGVTSLDIGQGDSTLVELSGGVQLLTDAGPPGSVVRPLENLLGTEDRYIDIAVVSHPQLDHFGGFKDLLGSYTFGAIIVNGRDDDSSGPGSPWAALKAQMAASGIPVVTVREGDIIRHGNEVVEILSPNNEFAQSGELNDTAIVELVKADGWSALLTADAGFPTEEYLVANYPDLHADILKIGHHGSRYSSSDAFLAAVHPRVALISDGVGNHYGHPSPETLDRLAKVSGLTVFRTDTQGTIEVTAGENGRLLVKTEK